MDVGEQAPHGKGESTVVDTTVRNVQRIKPSRIAFANPAWETLVQNLAKAAKAGLGGGLPGRPRRASQPADLRLERTLLEAPRQ